MPDFDGLMLFPNEMYVSMIVIIIMVVGFLLFVLALSKLFKEMATEELKQIDEESQRLSLDKLLDEINPDDLVLVIVAVNHYIYCSTTHDGICEKLERIIEYLNEAKRNSTKVKMNGKKTE